MKKYEVYIHIGLPETELTDDILKDFQKAVKHASYNLYGRHKVYVIFDASELKRNIVTLKLLDTEGILTKKNIPIHLRGIASYLIRENPDKYKPLKKWDNRLLHYYPILELEEDNSIRTLEDIPEYLSKEADFNLLFKGIVPEEK